MSKYLVLGIGKMGSAVVYDLLNSSSENQVTAIDVSKSAIRKLFKKHSKDKHRLKTANLSFDQLKFSQVIKKADCVVSCLPYDFNYELNKIAINARTHCLDLGGNNDIVKKQYSLEAKALRANVAIMPDCGVAPGYVSNLAGDLIGSMDHVYELLIRVGGIQENPSGPLGYTPPFSVHGWINEHNLPCDVIKNGVRTQVPPLEDLEDICFGGFPQLEAFNTSGGLSTLTQTMYGKVDNINYKTIRYKGHCEKMKLLFDLGLFEKDVRLQNEKKIAHTLGTATEDVILVRVIAKGIKNGKKVEKGYQIIDRYDPKTKLSAMQRNTGFSISILAQMLVDGRIKGRGVLAQELHVPGQKFISELKKRGIQILEI